MTLQSRIFHVLLDTAPDFGVVVHTKIPGVVLPEYLLQADDPLVLLQFGFGLARPPENLDTDVPGLWATLSFSTQPFRIFIPWVSIVAMGVPGRMEVGFQLEEIQEPPTVPARPALRLVK